MTNARPEGAATGAGDALLSGWASRLAAAGGEGTPKGGHVAVAMLLEWPGADERAYLSMVRALGLGDTMFRGAVLHLAGPTDDGWRAVDVWDSLEAFERFRSEKLDAAMAEVGLPTPTVDVWTVFSLVTPQGRPTPQE